MTLQLTDIIGALLTLVLMFINCCSLFILFKRHSPYINGVEYDITYHLGSIIGASLCAVLRCEDS